jgi:hypothetical protein
VPHATENGDQNVFVLVPGHTLRIFPEAYYFCMFVTKRCRSELDSTRTARCISVKLGVQCLL